MSQQNHFIYGLSQVPNQQTVKQEFGISHGFRNWWLVGIQQISIHNEKWYNCV